MDIYRISDLNIEIKTNSPTLSANIVRYKANYQERPNVTLAMSDDLLLELMEENEGVTADVVESTYIATLYCWALFDFNGFPIRATAVENDGECVLLAAPFDESFDPVSAIPSKNIFAYNYPGVRMQDDDYYVFDTPFGLLGSLSKPGHKLKLRSIVFADASRFDTLRRLEAKDIVPLFMRAVAKNIRQERTKHTLFVLERVMRRVSFYGTRDFSDYRFIMERV